MPEEVPAAEAADYAQRLSEKSADLLRSMQQGYEAAPAPEGEYADWMDNLARDLGITAAAPGEDQAGAAADIKTPPLDVSEDEPLIADAVLSQAEEQAADKAHAEEDELRRSILTDVDKAPSNTKKNRFFSFFRS